MMDKDEKDRQLLYLMDHAAKHLTEAVFNTHCPTCNETVNSSELKINFMLCPKGYCFYGLCVFACPNEHSGKFVSHHTLTPDLVTLQHPHGLNKIHQVLLAHAGHMEEVKECWQLDVLVTHHFNG